MTRTHEIKLDGYGAHTTLADDRPVMLLGTAESYGIEMLHIVPGKDWEGLTITATFNAADGTSTDILMSTDGNIAVPTEATAKSGSGRIVFTGVSDGIQRISCDLDYFVVAHSGINGTQSGGVTPSWFEQAAKRFMPLGGTTGQVLTKKTDADLDAEWQDSKGGITPTIGDNGNWFLGDTDTGKPSRGDNGKSAYSYAQDGGYTGTEEEFAAKLAADKLPNPYPLTFTGAVNETYDGSSAKTITIPSGGAHSDWNQNDSTAADYIKNRPFYTGDPVETVLVEESSVSFALSGGFYNASFPTSFNAELGQTYKISWDGTVYECTCKDFSNLPIIGNQSILGIGSDTGEPFVIFNESGLNETGWASLTTDTSASHTISISGIGVPVTKIDEKYLPELPYMDKVNPTGTGSFSLNRKANTTIGNYSFTEGADTTASGKYSHAEGHSTIASGDYSHAEGYSTTASGNYSHAEGHSTIASGNYSHAEGHSTIASGSYSHAEGYSTTASGSYSHAEGHSTTASGKYSHAEGYGTKASSKCQHVHGKYNIEDTSNTYAEIVGNGEQLENSNARTLDWSGNAWYAGTVEGKALILPSSTAGSTKKFKITVDDSGTITATEVV